jgi:hypothetical protein
MSPQHDDPCEQKHLASEDGSSVKKAGAAIPASLILLIQCKVWQERASGSKNDVPANGRHIEIEDVESDCDQAARRRRRRASAISPPQAASNPGRPAPTMGPGTVASLNEALICDPGPLFCV